MHIITESLYNLTSFFIIISFIVFIHEFGHYSLAKLFGVKIEAFAIGFGKELIGWSDKSGTRWKICVVPMGGYVKMHGDENAASMPNREIVSDINYIDRDKTFHAKPLYVKSLIVAGGPLANFLLAISILTFFFIAYGKPIALPVIDQIQANSNAEKAGFNIGDEIISIDNQQVNIFSDIEKILINSSVKEFNFKVKRDKDIIDIPVTPSLIKTKDAFGNEVEVARIGIISKQFKIEKYSIIMSLYLATKETYDLSASTIKAIGQMIIGKRGTEELGGPISIAKYSGQSVKNGFGTVLWFIVILSINLGLINLLPIPILDGGHLLFYAIEAIKGSPLSLTIQQYSFRLGLLLVLFLMVFSTFNDIKKIFVN